MFPDFTLKEIYKSYRRNFLRVRSSLDFPSPVNARMPGKAPFQTSFNVIVESNLRLSEKK